MNWPIGLYRVAGESMLPTFRPGDVLIGWRWFTPRPGQAVVIKGEHRPLVKRTVSREFGGWWVEGDNAAASTDSRDFGPVPHDLLEARVIARLVRDR